ncbi:MAG: DNA methyltransferase [Gemmatimonadota bacterium]
MALPAVRPNAFSAENNKLLLADRVAHDWYRFVLSYPPHLVRKYLEKFNATAKSRVLDPFCGTGTTLVECKRLGIPSVGIEGNPLASFASSVKLDWTPDPDAFLEVARTIFKRSIELLDAEGISDAILFTRLDQVDDGLRVLSPELNKLLLTGSISPRPLHKVLVLLEEINSVPTAYAGHYRLALAKALVSDISNLKFGPEVGVGKAKPDVPVVEAWFNQVIRITDDLRTLSTNRNVTGEVIRGDARNVGLYLQPCSVDMVITSPPYPNEKDYTRTTRLESVILGFLKSKDDLRALKRDLVRSNTRGVYKQDADDEFVASHPEIQRIANEIEARRVALNKTSGFERLYARVTKLYFGGMLRHLRDLQPILRPGARLAYVVGDQASYLRVMIRTGQLLGDLAESIGYQLEGIDLFRTRLATATKEQLREEVVLLKWNGRGRGRIFAPRSRNRGKDP